MQNFVKENFASQTFNIKKIKLAKQKFRNGEISKNLQLVKNIPFMYIVARIALASRNIWTSRQLQLIKLNIWQIVKKLSILSIFSLVRNLYHCTCPAGVASPSTADSYLKVSHLTRTRHAHQLSFLALSKLQHQAILSE